MSAAWEDSRMARKVHVLRGDGTVTVKEPCRINGEMLVPGVARFAPDAQYVMEAPHLFTPTWVKDTAVRAKLEHRMSANRRPTRRRARPVRARSVRSSGREPWRI